MYILNNNGPRIIPWGTPLSVVSQLEENSPFRFCSDVLIYCFLVVRYVLNQWAFTPRIP